MRTLCIMRKFINNCMHQKYGESVVDKDFEVRSSTIKKNDRVKNLKIENSLYILYVKFFIQFYKTNNFCLEISEKIDMIPLLKCIKKFVKKFNRYKTNKKNHLKIFSSESSLFQKNNYLTCRTEKLDNIFCKRI